MSWNVSDLFKIIELKARYFLAVWIFGALLIFIPVEMKQQMAIIIPEGIKPWIGFTTLAAFVLWLVSISMIIFTFGLQRINQWKNNRFVITNLDSLSRSEREIIFRCLLNNQRSINLSMMNPHAKSLASKGLLIMAGGTGDALNWPYTIPSWVWSYLKKNESAYFPELLDENFIREYKRNQEYSWMK